MPHKTYILSLWKHSQMKVYAIIVIIGFCQLKLVKDHFVRDPLEAPLPYPPLKKDIFDPSRRVTILFSIIFYFVPKIVFFKK